MEFCIFGLSVTCISLQMKFVTENVPSCVSHGKVTGASPVCSAPPLQAISHYAILCNSMGINIQLLAQPPIFLRSNINKRCAYHRENMVSMKIGQRKKTRVSIKLTLEQQGDIKCSL